MIFFSLQSLALQRIMNLYSALDFLIYTPHTCSDAFSNTEVDVNNKGRPEFCRQPAAGQDK